MIYLSVKLILIYFNNYLIIIRYKTPNIKRKLFEPASSKIVKKLSGQQQTYTDAMQISISKFKNKNRLAFF